MSERELEETFEKMNLQPFAVHCLEASKQRKAKSCDIGGRVNNSQG